MIERYSRPVMKNVWSEENKFQQWLRIEIAVCEAWAELGVIPEADMAKIRKAKFSPELYAEYFKITHHDVTAFLKSVSSSLGEESRWIHLGLTSSDIMDTATSLQLKEAAAILSKDIESLIEALKEKAIQHKKTIMIGRTHGVHAEPITFGLKLAIWIEEMKRNAARLAEATKVISVGKISGAVGTYATVPPEIEQKACERLGLAPAPVSNQILQRDRHAQFVTTLAIIGASLEKFATEIRALQRTEVLEAEEPFDVGQTGSSAMPHKRNPELCERICGLARLLRGYAMTSLENVALWHERDISHSSAERVILPDACLVLDYALSIFTNVMKGLNIYPDNMRRNLEITQGLVFSQRVLLALIESGLKRERAYELVQRNAMKAWRERVPFLNLLKADPEVTSFVRPEQLEALFDYSFYLKHIDTIFRRLGLGEDEK
ncbi:MAG: adenylosuccinate lyase [Dehalococcoidia bacterium]|nr:adenylosuccinate lyase [Dehalococcoidia bacterium]